MIPALCNLSLSGAMALTGSGLKWDDMDMSQLWHDAFHQAGIEMLLASKPDLVIAARAAIQHPTESTYRFLLFGTQPCTGPARLRCRTEATCGIPYRPNGIHVQDTWGRTRTANDLHGVFVRVSCLVGRDMSRSMPSGRDMSDVSCVLL
jgi:hypothetical protein